MAAIVSFHDVPIYCVNHAARTYSVPAELILAIIFVEGGRNGVAVKNTNGSFDYGVMQVNSFWLPHITDSLNPSYRLQYDACYNVMVGTWILKNNIQETPNLLHAIGNYHSHTPALNNVYARQVFFIYNKIRFLLAPFIHPGCDKHGEIC